MKTIETKNAPGAIGPYTQAKVVGNLLITSGQIPVDPKTGEMPKDIAAQAEQSCKNVKAIIEAAGGKIENTVKTVCFLSDINNFGPFNEVYAKYFTGKPARSCVAVRDIPKGALVEIEAIVEL
uniref:RidA family protein n=1 Tax=Ndongobacter massiliensis TaxID=1871025 RepID=UPI0009301078|nr:RidA family protein [Ndongobacter massiliensis]